MSTINKSNEFFHRLPVAATQLIFEFLRQDKQGRLGRGDDKAIMATARVCRHWQGNEVLRWERQAASRRLQDKATLHPKTSLAKVPVRTGQQYRFFDQMPDGLTELIWEFLRTDHKTIIGTAKVCLSWQQNKTIEFERKTAALEIYHKTRHIPALRILVKYPRDLVQLFRNNHAPIEQLPVLDLGGRRDEYIDFIKPDQMSYAVMRFTAAGGRPGIALKIQMTEALGSMKEADEMKPLVVVLAIFQRYPGVSKTWVDAWSNSSTIILNKFIKRHRDSKEHICKGSIQCPNYPTFSDYGLHPRILGTLLQNRDPDFFLPGHRIPEARRIPEKQIPSKL